MRATSPWSRHRSASARRSSTGTAVSGSPRRVAPDQGRKLRQAFDKAARTRAKARAIVFLHKDAFPLRDEFRDVTREDALSYGRGMLEKLDDGEPFADLARRYSNDAVSRARGGVLHGFARRPGESPEWIHWGDDGYPQQLLDLILETGKVGAVHPQPRRHRTRRCRRGDPGARGVTPSGPPGPRATRRRWRDSGRSRRPDGRRPPGARRRAGWRRRRSGRG